MARKNHVKKSGQSPYKRHGKSEYRYSDLYQRWRQALRDGRTGEARALSQQHSLRFFGRFTPAEMMARGASPLAA